MSGTMAVNGDRLTVEAETEEMSHTAHPIFKLSHDRILFYNFAIFGVNH